MLKAIVIGATGLVGRNLVQQLLADEMFSEVLVFVRRKTGLKDPRLQEYIIDFDDPLAWKQQVRGDVLFSALGTTLKQAGSKSAQYKIDFHYQYEFARAAADNGVPVYVLVSAAGASERSAIFYSRMKGELERDIKALPFKLIRIIKPGLLYGERDTLREGERLAFRILRLLNRAGLFKNYRPIHAGEVARAMINAALKPAGGVQVWTLRDVFALAQDRRSQEPVKR